MGTGVVLSLKSLHHYGCLRTLSKSERASPPVFGSCVLYRHWWCSRKNENTEAIPIGERTLLLIVATEEVT